MKSTRLVLSLAACCGLAWSQTGLTTIQDTLFKADGTRFNGALAISWNTFDATNVGTIVQQSKIVSVVNGNLQVQLAPNANAQPPANIYTVLYQSSGSQQFAETWTVPASTVALAVSAVRIAPQTNSGSNNGSSGNSTSNPTTLPESAIIGLQADLAQRPLMGVGYGTNAVAIVDDSGNLDTAVGDPGECVFVDGTTGQCNPPTFSDAETPAGTVDGTNNTMTLAGTPLGLSLMLFRNGLYQTPSVDYTLAGSTIMFISGAIPQPGDILTASYRVDTSASSDITGFTTGGVSSLHTAAAQVICSAAGVATNSATWTSLAGCDIPAAGLNPGDRIEVRFTFAHTGATAGFNVQVNWGSTTILTRTGGPQDAAIAGQAEAGVTADGADLTVQSWGTVLPFLPGILSAPQQQGVELTFKAAMVTAGPDKIALSNYTVLRYPAH